MTDSRNSGRSLAFVAALVLFAPGLIVNAQEGTTKSAQPVGNKQLCLRCHDDLNVVLEGAVVHGPVAADACTDCHNPHAARHGNLLREASRELCLSCHTDTAEALRAPVPHGALRSEMNCLSCHEAHASEHGALLRREESSLCADCHAPIRIKLAQEFSHAPAAAGDCSGCHEPHAGEDAGLLDQPVPALCWSCHDADAALFQSHEGFDVSGADCGSCHDPHGTGSAMLVRSFVHGVFEPGSCDLCHSSTTDPTQLEAAQPELCVTCHDSYDEHGDKSHPGGEAARCTSCHSPHAGEAPAMLRGLERSVCLDCHREIRTAIDRAESFHPLEAKEGRCTACHGLHEAENRPLLARPPEALCADCHTDHSRFTHPMGPNVPDPSRPGYSMDCLSCHTPHASQHKLLLLASPDRDLCVRCHQQLH